MKCPTCEAEEVASVLRLSGQMVTDMSTQHFFDKEGREHFHDRNRRSISARCSNGHTSLILVIPGCRVDGCDFGAGSKRIVPVNPRAPTFEKGEQSTDRVPQK